MLIIGLSLKQKVLVAMKTQTAEEEVLIFGCGRDNLGSPVEVGDADFINFSCHLGPNSEMISPVLRLIYSQSCC
jgi:hypothetical protein